MDELLEKYEAQLKAANKILFDMIQAGQLGTPHKVILERIAMLNQIITDLKHTV